MPDATERLKKSMPGDQLAVAKGAIELTAKMVKRIKYLERENAELANEVARLKRQVTSLISNEDSL